MASAAAFAAACGGGSSNNGNPGGPSPITGSPGPSGATITITAANAVSPGSVTINPGESVTFVNNSSRPHQIASDPHPAHTNCTEINALGTIAAGATVLTNALPTSKTCGFHDHNDSDNNSLKGTITIR
jgi:plastocyanin